MSGKDYTSSRHYWLIAKRGVGAPEIFSAGFTKREYLPVFSFAEEAEMFLKLRALGDEWRSSRFGSGELPSMLFGGLSGVERVALDPIPEIQGDGMITDLLSISRKKFMDDLLTLGCSWWVPGRDSEGQTKESG